MDSNVSAALAAEQGKNVISSVGLSAAHDYRDSTLIPTKGWLIVNSVDVAGGPLAGDKDFYRFQTSGNYYIPITFGETISVLKFGAKTGVIKPYGGSDNVPIFERYFAGGQETIRGYDERKIGPLDSNTEDSVGGEATVLGTVEYTVPLIDIVKAAVFFDTGNVWAQAKDYGSNGLKSGFGPGLRVKTPIGPINLDYGFPLNKQSDGDESKSGKFYFSVSRGF
jgi:outer membrane protein assembly factor BamA